MPRSLATYILMLATAVLLLAGASGGTAADAAHTEYFSGSCVTNIPASNRFLESQFLLERCTDPQAGTITERMQLLDRGGSYREHCRVLHVSGNSFRLDDGPDGPAVEGSLTGADWQWEFVSYSSSLEDGLQVESDASIDELGLLRETLIRDADGQVLVYIDETASPLTEQQYGRELTGLASRTRLISRS